MEIEFLVATLIITNKIIDKDKLNELWEVIKMLVFFELAREKGKEEGLEKDEKKGGWKQRGKWFSIRYTIYPAICLSALSASSASEIFFQSWLPRAIAAPLLHWATGPRGLEA